MGTKKKIAKLKSDLKRSKKIAKQIKKANAKFVSELGDMGIFANKKR